MTIKTFIAAVAAALISFTALAAPEAPKWILVNDEPESTLYVYSTVGNDEPLFPIIMMGVDHKLGKLKGKSQIDTMVIDCANNTFLVVGARYKNVPVQTPGAVFDIPNAKQPESRPIKPNTYIELIAADVCALNAKKHNLVWL